MGSPALSLILCSRNDAYLGNSRWRLETALNYIGERVSDVNGADDVEVIVSDWGSEVPLRNAVALTPAAARITSFLTVPPAVARQLQKDSPFPEVLALNAAARRASGRYIGRIDQDTLAGARFLRWMLALAAGSHPEGAPADPETSLLFANRRAIPYRLAVLCPPMPVVARYIERNGNRLKIETGKVFYNIDVGIWLLHRRLWDECGGYDERMIHMNDMEIDMAGRLMTRHPMINLGRIIDYDFYHLDHYHPGGSRSSGSHRPVNNQFKRSDAGFRPSGDKWGLADLDLDLSPLRSGRVADAAPAPVVSYAAYVGHAGFRVKVDRMVYPFYPVWKRRAGLAWAGVRGESPLKWPWILRKLWAERPSAKGSVKE